MNTGVRMRESVGNSQSKMHNYFLFTTFKTEDFLQRFSSICLLKFDVCSRINFKVGLRKADIQCYIITVLLHSFSDCAVEEKTQTSKLILTEG